MLDFLKNFGAKSTGKGSFRGVSFYIIDNAERSGGNRLIKHEYPLRDTVKIENMGRSAASTTINAVVIGNNCKEQADALIDALDNSESGELQHPDYKTQLVYVDQWNSRTVASEQRVVYFTITFTPDTDEESPAVDEDSLSIMGVLSDILGTDVVNDFVSIFNTVSEAISFVEDCMEFGEAIANGITGAIRGITSSSGLSSLLGKATSYKASLKNLFKAPTETAKELRDLLSGINDLRNDNKQKKSSKLTNSAKVPAVAQKQSREQKTVTPPAPLLSDLNKGAAQIFESIELNIKNATETKPKNDVTKALKMFIDVIIATEIAQAVIQDATAAVKKNQSEAIVTYDDCKQAIKSHGDKLQALIIASSDMYWYQTARALKDVKHAFVTQLEKLSTKLPAGKIITASQTEPALVMLYRETGNAVLIGQFTRRNNLKHPTFSMGGKNYEVINNG
jgi:prophage DNA circulation protein